MAQPKRAQTFYCELFGGFRLFDPQGVEIRVSVAKGRALLSYLLLNKKRFATRERLADLLWSKKSSEAGRTDLRQCLHKLKPIIARHKLTFLKVESDRVGIDPSQITTDLDAILAGAPPQTGQDATFSMDDLLYGFESLDPVYMEWIWEIRHAAERDIREALVDHLKTAADPAQRLRVAHFLHTLDPALEMAARAIIEACIADGDLGRMLDVYGALWKALDEGWEEEPSLELQALVGEARAQLGQEAPLHADGTVAPDDGAPGAKGLGPQDAMRGLEELISARDGPTTRDISTTRGSATRDMFIGRRSYLATIDRAWSEASRGQLQAISLQGPAGVGKTRIVSEFMKRVEGSGVRKVTVCCNRYDRSAPSEPLFAIAEQLGLDPLADGRAATDVPDQIAARLSEQPGVLFLDDWQWADDATRLALQDIAALSSFSPLLILVAARDVSLDDGLVRSSDQILLPPMNLREVSRFAEQLLNRPVDASLATDLYKKSGGIPLYLEEICYAYRDHPGRIGMPSTGSLSANLRSLIAARVAHLGVADAQFLFAAAPQGEAIDLSLIAEVQGSEAPEPLIERLCGLDVLYRSESNGALRFKHGITREVIYEMIPKDRRLVLHKSYLDALLKRTPASGRAKIVELLAHHARASGDHYLAGTYSEQAGDKALAASSLDQAQRHFENAMESLDHFETSEKRRRRWLSLALRWVKPCIYAASPDHVPVLEKAEDIADTLQDPQTNAIVAYWIGYFSMVMGEYDKSEAYLQKALEFAKQTDLASLIVEITAILGCSVAAQCRGEEADRLLTQSLQAKEQNPSRSGRVPVTSAYLRAVVAVSHADHGEFETARENIAASLERLADFEHEIESSVLCLAATIEIWQGNWERARLLAQKARTRSERVCAPYQIGISRALYCYAHWRLTGDAEVLNEMKRMAYWLETTGMHLYLSIPFGLLADALAEVNRPAEARVAAQRALERLDTGEAHGAVLAHRALARVAAQTDGGDLTEALRHLQAGRAIAAGRQAPHEMANCALTEAELLLGRGQGRAAEAALAKARPIYERLSMRWHLEQANRLSQECHAARV